MHGALRLASRIAVLAATYATVLATGDEYVLAGATLLAAAFASLLLRRRGLPWPPLMASVSIYLAYTMLYAHLSGRTALPALRFPLLVLLTYLSAATLTGPEKSLVYTALPRRLVSRIMLLQSIFNGVYHEAREAMLDVRANYHGRLRRAAAYTGSMLSNTPSLVVETAEYMVVHGISGRGTRASSGEGDREKHGAG